MILTSLPSPYALAAVAAAIAATPEPRVVVETSTMALSDKLAAHDVLVAAGHTALDCTTQRHRRAGGEPRPRHLCQWRFPPRSPP